MRKIIAILVFAVPGIVASNVLAIGPTTSFVDGTFDDSDWTFTSITNSGSGGLVQSIQIGSGGSPDEYREVTNSMLVGSNDEGSNVIGLHISNSATYDPSILGGIESIDFDIDFNNLVVQNNGQAYGLALVQGGDVFVAQLAERTNTPPTATAVWNNKLPVSIVASDFFRVDTTVFNLVDHSVEPDFSSTGSPIELGFFTRNSLPPGSGPGTNDSQIVGYDNWEVVIRQVPEPTTCTLALAVLCMALKRRRARFGL